MATINIPEFDLRAKILELDRVIAQTEQARADVHRAFAQAEQSRADVLRANAHVDLARADHDRRRQEMKYQPIIAMISGMTAGAALLAAGAAFTKIFGG